MAIYMYISFTTHFVLLSFFTYLFRPDTLALCTVFYSILCCWYCSGASWHNRLPSRVLHPRSLTQYVLHSRYFNNLFKSANTTEIKCFFWVGQPRMLLHVSIMVMYGLRLPPNKSSTVVLRSGLCMFNSHINVMCVFLRIYDCNRTLTLTQALRGTQYTHTVRCLR